jgi:hypothetical protein
MTGTHRSLRTGERGYIDLVELSDRPKVEYFVGTQMPIHGLSFDSLSQAISYFQRIEQSSAPGDLSPR